MNNNNKYIIFLYYLVNERFMLLNTYVKGKYIINKNIKK